MSKMALAFLSLLLVNTSADAGPGRRLRERIQERRLNRVKDRVLFQQPVWRNPPMIRLLQPACPDGKCPLPKR